MGVERQIDLDWFERPSRERTLHLVPHGQGNTRFPEFFGAQDGDAEVIANVFDSRSLKISTGGLGIVDMIGIQVDRDACALTKPGLES